MQETPRSYYAFRPDYDYNNYLEQKSHFDRIEIRIDRGIRELIGSHDEISKSLCKRAVEISAAIDDSNQKIIDGLEVISLDINKIESKLENLSGIIENGFANILFSLENISDGIDKLVNITNNPEKIWAYEQYRDAWDAYRRGFLRHALAYIERSIYGHGERIGFPLEPRFYLLKGRIFLGTIQMDDQNITNLSKALENFDLAQKYSQEKTDRSLLGEILMYIGFTQYCLGQMDNAIANTTLSIEIDRNNDESTFNLSKYYAHIGNENHSMFYLRRAILLNRNFAIRAGGDDDFLNLKDSIVELISSILNNKTEKFQKKLHGVNLIAIEKFLQQANKYVGTSRYIGSINNLINSSQCLDNVSLCNVDNILNNLENDFQSALSSVDNVKASIKSLISSNERKIELIKPDPVPSLVAIRWMAGIGTFFGFAVLIAITGIEADNNSPLAFLIFGLSIVASYVPKMIQQERNIAESEKKKNALRNEIAELKKLNPPRI